MRNPPLHAVLRLARLGQAMSRHERGSVLVEAAFALPLMIVLLLGILLYGGWLMTAGVVAVGVLLLGFGFRPGGRG